MASVNSSKKQEHDLALFPYIGRLDLDQAPFFTNSDNEFFYSDPNIKQYLDLLRHLTQSSNLVPVVLSPKQGGKSSLLQAFIRESDSNSKICTIDASQENDRTFILKEIAKSFDVSIGTQSDPDEKSILHLLHRKAIELYQNSAYPVIAIENAQYLQDDACKLLLSMQQGIEDRENTWHILFFADCRNDESPKLYNINISEYPQLYILLIEPFNLEQTKNYIGHRLMAAGYKGELPLTEESIKYIHAQSKGLPGKINELSHSALIKLSSRNFGPQFDYNPGTPPTTKSRSSLHKILFISALLVVGAGVLLYFQNEINTAFGLSNQPQTTEEVTANHSSSIADDISDDTSTNSTGNPGQAKVNQLSPASQDATIQPGASATHDDIENSQQAIKKPSDISGPVDKELSEKTVIDNQKRNVARSGNVEKTAVDIPSLTQAITTERVTTTKAEKLLPETIQDDKWLLQQEGKYTVQLLGTTDEGILGRYINDGIKGREFKHEIGYYLTDTDGEEKHTLVYGSFETYYQARQAITKLPESVKSNGPWPVKLDDVKKKIALQHQRTEQKSLATQPAPSHEKSNIQKIEKDSNADNQQKARAWIAAQNSEHYTIQLLSTGTRDSLLVYINRFKLHNNSVLYQTTRHSKDWHVLFYGIYENRDNAKTVVDSLPAEIQVNKPWIRKMGDLQKEVRINSR